MQVLLALLTAGGLPAGGEGGTAGAKVGEKSTATEGEGESTTSEGESTTTAAGRMPHLLYGLLPAGASSKTAGSLLQIKCSDAHPPADQTLQRSPPPRWEK